MRTFLPGSFLQFSIFPVHSIMCFQTVPHRDRLKNSWTHATVSTKSEGTDRQTWSLVPKQWQNINIWQFLEYLRPRVERVNKSLSSLKLTLPSLGTSQPTSQTLRMCVGSNTPLPITREPHTPRDNVPCIHLRGGQQSLQLTLEMSICKASSQLHSCQLSFPFKKILGLRKHCSEKQPSHPH